jgi:hypothetical protein
MNGCAGCFAVMALLFFAMLAIGFVATYWAPILGLGGAWVSWRYVRSWYAGVD